jgi:hypothetical protein
MADVTTKEGFADAAGALVNALQSRLGNGFRPFTYFESASDKGIAIIPEIVRERRTNPGRATLQLRLLFPEPAWMDFSHAAASLKEERADAFAEMFVSRLPELEAWYGFKLEGSSQDTEEPIDLKFEVIGASAIPGVDGEIV